MAKRKADVRVETADDRALEPATEPAAPTSVDVARRAYERYVARGYEHGHDVEDWLEAEHELRGSPAV